MFYKSFQVARSVDLYPVLPDKIFYFRTLIWKDGQELLFIDKIMPRGINSDPVNGSGINNVV